jgi:hypothetical protein
MDKTIRLFSLLTLALTAASGQAMLEHALAAGGASAGAVAGKSASDALNSLGDLLGKAGKTGEEKKELVREATPKPASKAKAPVVLKAVAPSNAGATAIAVGSGVYYPEPPHAATQYRSQPVPMPVPAPVYVEPRQARSEDLARVEPGMSRSDVLAMGAFGSRITIPGDDGHVLEVLQYDKTTVRMEDGKVISVGRN